MDTCTSKVLRDYERAKAKRLLADIDAESARGRHDAKSSQRRRDERRRLSVLIDLCDDADMLAQILETGVIPKEWPE